MVTMSHARETCSNHRSLIGVKKMTANLLGQMPASLNEVADAKATWSALANLVTDDANPTVTLKAGDALIDGLELLTALTAVTVADGTDGEKIVTLMLETPAAAPAPKTSVKEAAAAPSSFAGQEDLREREVRE